MKTLLRPKECKQCGQIFEPQNWHRPVDWQKARFCSRACSSKFRTIPIKERFGKNTRKTSSGCIEWTAYSDPKGYGRSSPNQNGEVLSHRIAFEMAHGKIPEGMHVLHHCDNRKCVNVSHLYLGTNDDNVRDRCLRNRNHNLSGENNPRSKLKLRQVCEIRKSGASRPELANRFGVSEYTIYAIQSGLTWKAAQCR